MNEREIEERVAKIRACKHNQWHYLDANGNRCCGDCQAFVRAPKEPWPTIELRKLIER
ncbi:hypothetical protein [Mycobacteroides chelonae]|uniref:hypothetical protein n=1 Tax=Mycobacteroides chelonae TaxID=1774 RepID=UPI001FB125AB|nr:hypothetical protein [Mycobacteroides chelonae]